MLEFEHVVEAFVADFFAHGLADLCQDGQIVLGVIDRLDPAFPNLKERVGARCGQLQALELDPTVGRQPQIGILHRGGHDDVLGDDHLDARVDVLEHVVGMLGVVEQVHIVEMQRLGRRRHVRLAGEAFAAGLGRVNDQRHLTVVPVGRLLTLALGRNLDLFAVCALIEIEVERIFGDPTLEARTGLRAALEQCGLVVSGPGVYSGALLADVAGQHHRQICGPIRLGGVEPVVDAFALMNRDRPAVLCGLPDVARQALDHLLGATGHLSRVFDAVVLQMNLIHLPERLNLDFAPIDQLDLPLAVQDRVDRRLLADFVAGQRDGLVGLRVPDHTVADFVVLLVGQTLHLVARAVLGQAAFVAGEDLVGPQPLERVGPHQQREIGELFDEFLVVPLFVDHVAGDAKP